MSFARQGSLIKTNQRQLPLLEAVRSAYPFSVLDDVYIICAQHLLRTSAILFHNLFQMGLDPNHFSVIGKCYSTDPAVYSDLKNILGLDISSSSKQFSSAQSFDSQYKEDVKKFLDQRLEKILASGCRRVIVMDDGGELIQAIHSLIKNDILPAHIEVVGVEQTSSGFRKLQTFNLIFPVINVARSSVKLQLESSLIADGIINNLWVAFEEINIRPNKALLLGRGAIGAKVEEKLSLYCSVDSFDPAIDGCSIQYFDDIDFERYNLIIGCSGKEVINISNNYLFTKKTILASGSSSDREFCGVTFRAQLNREPQCHEHICANGIYLLNCGFPVNFSNHYHLVDDDRYQLTRALLLAGILQAQSCTTLSGCFIDLNSSVQRVIHKQFFSLYPNFDKDNLKESGGEEVLPSIHF